MLLDEKLTNPPEIIEFIKENYEGGINGITPLQVHGLVEKMYRIPEKRKLIVYFENLKLKPVITNIQKMLLHMAINIGPKANINEDIEENLKDPEMDSTTQALGTTLQQTDSTLQLNQTIAPDQPAATTATAATPVKDTPSKEKGGKGSKSKGKGKKGQDESQKTP